MGDVNIMLMENTLRIRDDAHLKYVFDLKGSKVDRKVKGKTKNSTTLKDINFLMASRVNSNLADFGRHRKRLLKALRKDVEYLRSQGLMDYSLLLGIESVNKETNKPDGIQIRQTELISSMAEDSDP